MNLRTFIERPVFSAVISITIVILGIIGLFTLPVEQYPDIAPPTVMVSTTYYGASAETLQKCYRSVGRSYQRCGRHDLYDVYRYQCRFGIHYRLFQTRNRPGYGCC